MYINRALMVLVIAGGLAILGAGVAGQPSALGAPSAPQSIVGTWLNVPTPYTGGPVILGTYTSDGTVIASRPSGLETGQIGVWTSTGDHTVVATTMYFEHKQDGTYADTVKVRAQITLNATYDELTGSGTWAYVDAQGNDLGGRHPFTQRGTRMKVEGP